MSVIVKVSNQWARVIQDGKEVKAFNLLSEDYAVTLARKHASILRKAEKEGANDDTK